MTLKLVSLSAASAALYAVIARVSALPGAAYFSSEWYDAPSYECSVEFWVLWLGLVGLYAIAVHLARDARGGRPAMTVIIVAALAFRAIVLWSSAFDAEPRAAFLQSPTPLTTLGNELLPSETTRRLAATGFDVAAMALAPSLLTAAGLPVTLVVVHAWNPLAIIESSGRGRLELAAFFLLLWSIKRAQKGQRAGAAALYGACLTGPLTLVSTAPLMTRLLGSRGALAVGIGTAGWWLSGVGVGATWLERIGWPPEGLVGGSLTPVLSALASLFVTRSPWPPLALAIGVGFTVITVRALRIDTKNPSGQIPREALFASVGLLFVAPEVLPVMFVLAAYLGAYTHNRGWLFFTATAPVSYVAGAISGFGFWMGFAQFFLPFTALVFWGLGRPPPRRAAG